MAKLSVITVTYNAAPLLSNTIESVVNQTFTEVQYLIIDGKSQDDSVSILTNYQNKYPHLISFSSEKDNGIYDAMNKGLNQATGEFVIFLNAGDTFINNTVLENIFAKSTDNDDVIYGQTMLAKMTGEELGLRSEITTRKLPKQLTWKSMKYGMMVCHQSFIARREIAPDYIENNLSADIDWATKCLKKAKSIKYYDGIISKFLVGGISDQKKSKSLKDRFKVIKSHFGLAGAISAHAMILLRAIRFKLS